MAEKIWSIPVWFMGFAAAWLMNTIVECQLIPARLCYVIFAVVCLWAAFSAWKQRDEKHILRLIGAVMACFGLLFVLKFSYMDAWHDVMPYTPDALGTPSGNHHIGYVQWFIEKGSLPLVNPLEDDLSIFAHPPLFYAVMAVFLKVNLLLGIPLEAALENLQVLNMAFSLGCWYTMVQIVREWKTRCSYAGALLAAAQPILFMLGCALNNDIFSVLCILRCLMWALRWLRTKQIKPLALTGCWLGLGMATKFTAALLIPALGVVMAIVFLRDLRSWRKYTLQYGVFLLISVPLGIAWPLYQLLKWGVPLGFVRAVDAPMLDQLTLWQRYGFPGSEALKQLFFRNSAITDHNFWFQLLKTAMFDEKVLFRAQTWMWYVSYAALIAYALWMAMAVFSGRRFLRKCDMPCLLMVLYAATLFLYNIKFTLDMPYVCSINFRYIVPLILPAAISWANHRPTRMSKATGLISCGLSVIVYGAYFFG